MITYIPINQLYPHWDNPRKDLGDLTELAESIKVRGILQNLTVVPGHKLTGAEVSALIRDRSKTFDEFKQATSHSPEGYTVVIGHRRLAAAKLAGLTELPCAISDMDYKTQISTMLLENMQRSDLTVYEQAKGFQMMLDLGDSVPVISEQTGFSETTVRSRVKLLELDEKEFKASEKKNVTLAEYAKLNKIENVKMRNHVLKSIGTNNFNNELQKALDCQKRQKKMAVLVEQVKTFATEVNDTNYKKWIKAYYPDVDAKIEPPKDAAEVTYYYMVSNYGAINLYCDNPIAEDPKEQAERDQREEKRRSDLTEESNRAKVLRADFIRNLTDAEVKKHQMTAIKYLVPTLISSYCRATEKIIYLTGLADINGLSEDVKIRPERYLIAATYSVMTVAKSSYDWCGEYGKNEYLDTVYEFLKEMGYEMSDDEKALQDGTHRLFSKEES